MGIPDMWVNTLKYVKDDDWNLGYMWGQLTVERPSEKTVHYVESHDQALVGDKTVIFRLLDKEQYVGMDKIYHSAIIDRGIALHKMIRLFTISAGGDGYLNFMGNEFGHPEWIDFPREGNGGSYKYCRRQWNLVDNHFLKYEQLNEFDKDMIALAKKYDFYSNKSEHITENNDEKIIAFRRGKLLFIFNFHPSRSYEGYEIPSEGIARCRCVLSTDEKKYSGFGREDKSTVYTPTGGKKSVLRIYLPSRTAAVFETE